jgi:uncharacterized membrane protein
MTPFALLRIITPVPQTPVRYTRMMINMWQGILTGISKLISITISVSIWH